MNLKPWREIAEPHSDVREGKFQQAEFAADLSRVHAGTANEEYQNPTLFFQRTFITEGMYLCERKDWAEDARGYNDLVTAWSGIEAGRSGKQTETIF